MNSFNTPLLIDGGLSNVLEDMGYDLNHPLWSARMISEHPEALVQAHLKYLKAGAQCIATASYQATIPGLLANGFTYNESVDIIKKSVTLAKNAIDTYLIDHPQPKRPLLAASMGPYGAFLADGSEYRGNYGVDKELLIKFHTERMDILNSCNPDVLAFETFPDRLEVEVISELIIKTKRLSWVSLSCKDGKHINDGTPIEDVVKILHKNEYVGAIGINCTHPKFASELIQQIRKTTNKNILIYPNSGELYDPITKTWKGTSNVNEFADMVRNWMKEGASIVGGCCRIGPEHIKAVKNTLF